METTIYSFFWPAVGIASGVLIALGPGGRWPVTTGVIVAEIALKAVRFVGITNSLAITLLNTAEPLIVAGLIHHFCGVNFTLDRLRNVFALFAAAVLGCGVIAIGWAIVMRYTLALPILTTWRDLLVNDSAGIVLVAPLTIGVVAAARQPPPVRELIEGAAVVVLLGVMTGIVILLPQELWDRFMPIAWLFPILLWLAARYRALFSAGGAFVISMMIISTTIFGIGHFGDPTQPIGDRSLQGTSVMLFLTISAIVLAALFAERRGNEARLAHSNILLERERERLDQANMMLQRERDNKLMSAQAVTAAIAHEIRQPLVAITTNAGAALRWLGRTPPDHNEIRAALDRIKTEGHRASEVFDGIRALFGRVDRGRQSVDVNGIVVGVMQSLQGQLTDHQIEVHRELTDDLPLVTGHEGQLREVVFNLVNNALEAMDITTDRQRVLSLRTELRGRDALAVSVQDSGPGIDPKQLDGIFGAFVSTKANGTGLGLAICHMIIEHHGGQLTASSDGKSGTMFQFVLPIKEEANTFT
jgi:signal transduction histidine kinase